MRYIYLVLTIFICQAVMGQNAPSASGRPAATAIAIPAAYTTPTLNLLRTWEPKLPTTDSATVVAASNTLQQVKQISQYLDGLGRLLQVVTKGASPAGNDIVAPTVYDAFGREQFSYLPYVQTGVSDGGFKTDPFNSQKTFYQNATLNPGVAGESIFYNQTQYEQSPLNRVLKTFSAGNSWAAEGGNKPVTLQYQYNTVANGVRIWMVPANGAAPVSGGVYTAGQLIQNVSVDEQGNRVNEFKDKAGRVVLKKVGNPGTTDDHTGWLCTYYVYDDLGNLRCVIPPKAVESIKATWVIPIGVYSELCFQYTYDGRNRMITKKIPGKAIIEMAYDIRDRLVYSRDGNMKSAGNWMVTFYDVLNRPIETALYAGADSLGALQSQLTGTGTLNPSPSPLTPQTYTFYDDYTYAGAKAAVTAELSKPSAAPSVFAPYSDPNTSVSAMTKGLITGKKILVVGTSQWLTTSLYYNDKARMIQTVSDNLQGGQVTVSSLYDFTGKVLGTYLHQTNPRSTLMPDTKVITSMSYDASGRLLTVTDTLNGDATTGRLLIQNTYDELGRLKKSTLGNGKENLAYEYNIKGWLNSINKAYLDATNGELNHFAEVLSYDYGFTKNQYNGNIAGVKWRGFNDGVPRTYGFAYDSTNRLTLADFNQQNTLGAAWTVDKVNFSVNNLTYDPNGNINSMAQMGMKGATRTPVDYLNYQYLANSNKLTIVTDTVKNPGSTLGDFKESAQNVTDNQAGKTDYSYDVNGNLTTDANKGITYITYNYLNLPERIQINGKGRITYLYGANGSKLRKTVADSTSTPTKLTVTDYVAGMVYQNDTLQLISHEQGRIHTLVTAGQPVKYVYDYFVKDHLGNIREVLTEKSDTAVYSATMETAMSAKENVLFSNIDNTRAALPSGYPTDNTTNPNAYIAALNADNGKKIGPSLVLRVMAGDTINIATSAFYKSVGANTRSSNGSAAQMLSALVQAFSGGVVSDGPHAGTGSLAPIATNLDSVTYNQLVQNNAGWSTNPKAYLNYVIFDDQFNLESNSGVKQVPANPNVQSILTSGSLAVKSTGFLYVYVSNESGQEVDFDNLVVTHVSGPLLEETHYYPFGLTMAGISSHAMGKLDNRYKYNGKELQSKEFVDGSGLDLYDYGARMQDPQVGRWGVVDPMVEKYESVSQYAYAYNNPIRFVDIKGEDPGDVVIAFGGADILGQKDKGGAPLIIQQIQQQYLSKKGGQGEAFYSQYWNTFHSNEESMDRATQSAYDYVVANYNKDNGKNVEGGKVVLQGYSYGGVMATHLARRLKKANIPVSLLVTVDAAAGPESNNLDRTIPSNVDENINIYQTNPSIVRSHGDKNKKEEGSNTDVVNIDVTSITNEHGKIDDYALRAVVNQILSNLSNRGE